jgi:hypothetical protein
VMRDRAGILHLVVVVVVVVVFPTSLGCKM